MLEKIAPYWKAVLGFITPGVVALVAAVQTASPGGENVTTPEWVGIGAACILTGGLVFSVKNRQAYIPTEKSEENNDNLEIVDDTPVESDAPIEETTLNPVVKEDRDSSPLPARPIH